MKMRNTILFLTLVFCFQAFAQRKPKIKGNKNVVEVRNELPAFNAIELIDDLKIVLKKSSLDECLLKADDNLIDVLKFKVVDSTLFITSFYKIVSKKKLEIQINYQDLNTIILRDGRIEMDDVVSTNVLNVHTFGSSKLTLNANTEFLNVEMHGNSSADFNIESEFLSIAMKDKTDAGVYSVSETAAITLGKNASLKIDGTTTELEASLIENSSFKGHMYEAESAKLNAAGSSTAKIHARSLFQLNSSGTAKTSLYGEAEIQIDGFLDKSQLQKERIK